jgi:hypothetical protein
MNEIENKHFFFSTTVHRVGAMPSNLNPFSPSENGKPCAGKAVSKKRVL